MINALKNIGAYLSKKDNDDNILNKILEDPTDSGRYPYLILVIYSSVGSNWLYQETRLMSLTPSMKNKILYKRGSSNGPDITPTSKITTLEKTFPNKYVQWFKNNQSSDLFKEDIQKILHDVNDSTQKNYDLIFKDIQLVLDEITDKKGCIITPALLDENNTVKFIGDLPSFPEFVYQETITNYRYSKTAKTYSQANDQICSVCNQKALEVFGFFTDLKFYTVDKPGMVTGGFDCNNAWKNYPVCLNCALDIFKGFQHIKHKFNFKFYGVPYYFIPNLSDPEMCDTLLQALETYREQSYTQTNVERITDDEEEIFSFVKNIKNTVTFDLLFYSSPQKEVLRILLLIEDILPSRIATLLKTKNTIDSIYIFNQFSNKEGNPLYFNFGILRNFFPNTKMEGNYDKYFLEITQKIFQGSQINKLLILRRIMTKVRSGFITSSMNPTYFEFDVLKGFMLILYLSVLNLLDNQGEVSMNSLSFKPIEIKSKEELPEKVDEFFEQFKSSFPDPARKATFLLGVLTQFLLNIQKKEKGGTAPFRSHLKGLKMNAYDVISLLPEVVEKLEQYDKNYYVPLETYISKTLLEAGHYSQWRIPLDELNFLFVLGMNLSSYFKIKTSMEESNHE
ncbi:MAG: TIGR02556 family CRISPR-associated protein [Candidatus Marinimicrobia bacterium]|nr:TIGR02556 family CRISPR-associated protein [Candidatus Neomarinimicrobiota bacterium]MDD5583233.1 TIGR02556 family CRISPR-associated protein [Candidatus Neomarinimicrobiota bacterium]